MHYNAQLNPDELEFDDLFEDIRALTCPSCGSDLVDDELFLSHRVCGDCGRHFSMTARDRTLLVADADSFQVINTAIPLEEELDNDQISAIDRIAEQRERPVLEEAIVVGTAAIGGAPTVIISLDDQLLGSHIGALGAEKIIIGLEHALARRLPVIALCAGGAARTHAGPLAMVQGGRLAAVSAQLQVAGVPMIAVLTHPTSAEVFSSFASQCDVIFAEPGTQLGVTWSSSQSLDAVEQALTDEMLLTHGWIDGVVSRIDLREHLENLLDLLGKRGSGPLRSAWAPTDPTRFPDAESMDERSHGDGHNLERPRGTDYLARMVSSFVELRGDRVDADDRKVICGLGRLEGMAVAMVAQDRSAPHVPGSTAAIRKVQRMARLAGRFEIPLILLVDCPAKAGTGIVRPDESLAIAKLGSMMAMLPVPVVSVAVGTVRGAMGNVLMTGDERLMMEHATYHLAGSVVSRGGRFPVAPAGVDLGQEWPTRECERLGLVDVIVAEPNPGVEADAGWAAMQLQAALVRSLSHLSNSGPRRLVETRHRRHRFLGQETEIGQDAIRLELKEWQEVQQSVAKSFEDLRERFGQRISGPSRLSFQRPDLGDLATRLRARREELRQELLERTGRGDRSGQ